MSGKELKLEKMLSSQDAAVFLRALAAEIENGAMEQPREDAFDLKDFKKIKIEIKRVGSQVELKGKVKFNDPETGCRDEDKQADKGKPKYKSVKKRMEKTFKHISAAAEKGVMPDRADIEAFVADSDLMVSYPGHGDEHYEAYSTTCVQLNVAFENNDLAALRERCGQLEAMRKHCHDQYK